MAERLSRWESISFALSSLIGRKIFALGGILSSDEAAHKDRYHLKFVTTWGTLQPAFDRVDSVCVFYALWSGS